MNRNPLTFVHVAAQPWPDDFLAPEDMHKVVKLDTTTVTFAGLVRSTVNYSVPIFQRGYSWGDEQISQLWDDLISMYDGRYSEREYFLGSMVFVPNPEVKGSLRILDGQQRFATLLLILAALRECIANAKLPGKDDRISLLNSMVYDQDIVSLQKRIKLDLNRQDHDYFEAVVLKGETPDPKLHSQQLIKSAYSYLREELENRIKKDKNRFVEGLLEIVLDRLVLIRMQVDNDTNAHTLFETLNDRGLELSEADLVKNYLLSLCQDAHENVDEALGLWQDVVDPIGDYEVTKFLRRYWLSSEALIRTEELYKSIKAKVTIRTVKSFLKDLGAGAEVYANLTTPTETFWGDDVIIGLLDDLSVLGVSQVYVLLLAAYERFSSHPNKLKELLQALVNLTFRYSTVTRSNPNELERLYSELAIKLRGKAIDLDSVLAELKRRSPSSEAFRTAFAEMGDTPNKLGRYILTRINNELLGRAGEREKTTNVSSVHLEHIVPKKPNAKWKEFLEKAGIHHADIVNRLGNMTILLAEYNRSASNGFFTDKKEMYAKSTLPINEGLKSLEQFGQAELEKRQHWYSELADGIWTL